MPSLSARAMFRLGWMVQLQVFILALIYGAADGERIMG